MKKKHQLFKEVLDIIEKESTCSRIKTAALNVKDNRIISTGWNGVPSGIEHCENIFKVKNETYYDEHHEFSLNREIHCEQNAIGIAAKNEISIGGADLYISISPCRDCAKLIIASGIKNVYYKELYDREPNVINFLEECGILVECLGKK